MKPLFSISLVGLLLLTGCTSTANDIASESDTDYGNETTESFSGSGQKGAFSEPDRELSERGKHRMQLGDGAILTSQSGEEVLRFSVRSIERWDVTDCPNVRANPPENGNFIVLDIEMEATSEYDQSWDDLQPDNPLGWRMIDSDGMTVNVELGGAPVHYCIDGAGWLPRAAPGEKGEGLVVLDAPTLQGVLLHEEHHSNTGWEWEFDLR